MLLVLCHVKREPNLQQFSTRQPDLIWPVNYQNHVCVSQRNMCYNLRERNVLYGNVLACAHNKDTYTVCDTKDQFSGIWN